MNEETQRRATVLTSVIETFRPNLSQWAAQQVATAVAGMATADLEAAATYLLTKGVDRHDGRSIPGLLTYALDRVREERARAADSAWEPEPPMSSEDRGVATAAMRRLREERQTWPRPWWRRGR